jgi:hypothetical protein
MIELLLYGLIAGIGMFLWACLQLWVAKKLGIITFDWRNL